MTPPILTQEDLRSQTWLKIKAHIDADLAILRINLESDVSPERTATLRGRIRSYTNLLALGDTPTLATTEDDPE